MLLQIKPRLKQNISNEQATALPIISTPLMVDQAKWKGYLESFTGRPPHRRTTRLCQSGLEVCLPDGANPAESGE